MIKNYRLQFKRTIAYVSKQKRLRKVNEKAQTNNQNDESYQKNDSTHRNTNINIKNKTRIENKLKSPPAYIPPSTSTPTRDISNLLNNILNPQLPPPPRSTSILDVIFTPPPSADTYGLHLPYASDQTPIVSEKSQIHGVYSQFVEYLFSKRLINLTPNLYSCPYFTATYYPSNHFLCKGRKSRPSLISIYTKGLENNGESYPKSRTSPNSFKRSKNPINYAVWRNYINKLLKEVLYEALSNSSTPIPDGVFMIRTSRVTTNKSILQTHMNQVVIKAKQMPTKWVDNANSKVDYYKFNQILKTRFLPPVKA